MGHNMQSRQLTANWGIEISGVTVSDMLAKPAVFRESLYNHKMMVIRGLPELSESVYWQIHTAFGRPWDWHMYDLTTEAWSDIGGGKCITTYGNVQTKKSIGNRQMPWHRDIPWHRDMRYPIRSLYPRIMTGGASNVTTDFCDCDAVWNQLTSQQSYRLTEADVRIQHWYSVFTKQPFAVPTSVIPLTEIHPYTNRRSVLLNSFWDRSSEQRNPTLDYSTARTGGWIVDCWSRSEQLGVKYISELHKLACIEPNIYRHHWSMGDLVLFDNMSGVFHSRSGIADEAAERVFWRMNVAHTWQKPVTD